MDHLSGLDASFLHLETTEMPMHVGGLHLLELPVAEHAEFADRLKRHIADRMHLAPVFHRKLSLMPFELANPVWVEDDDVDLDYHIRQVSLPRPGVMKQLEAYVGRLHSNLLDRTRPLWEFYVITGLKSGQLAFYTKIHHAALDGQGAMVLAQALLDTGPVPREVPPPEPHPAVEPQSGSRMLAAALRATVNQCVSLARAVPEGVRSAVKLGLPRTFGMAPRTPFNTSISNQRAFATYSAGLAEVAAIGKFFDAKVNDAVLGIVSGALRRYLIEHEALPGKPLVAAVPVSLREQGNDDINNQVSMLFQRIATDIEDPAERMRAIAANGAALKKTLAKARGLLPTDFPSLGLPWLMSAGVAIYGRARLADNLPPIANLVVSNVPGAQKPLYLAGAKVLSNFPVSIVTHGLALNITVQSHDGVLDFGILACRRTVPDLQLLAGFMEESFKELKALAVPRKRAPRRKSPKAEGD